jgi:hypothetical protein
MVEQVDSSLLHWCLQIILWFIDHTALQNTVMPKAFALDCQYRILIDRLWLTFAQSYIQCIQA